MPELKLRPEFIASLDRTLPLTPQQREQAALAMNILVSHAPPWLHVIAFAQSDGIQCEAVRAPAGHWVVHSRHLGKDEHWSFELRPRALPSIAVPAK